MKNISIYDRKKPIKFEHSLLNINAILICFNFFFKQYTLYTYKKTVKRQTGVTAYLKREKSLLFAFARQNTCVAWLFHKQTLFMSKPCFGNLHLHHCRFFRFNWTAWCIIIKYSGIFHWMFHCLINRLTFKHFHVLAVSAWGNKLANLLYVNLYLWNTT